jgi:hypothetical protein
MNPEHKDDLIEEGHYLGSFLCSGCTNV